MKFVLISIRPKWCRLIASGKKTIEVRKTYPKLPTPFKCYIYETKARTDTPTFIDEDGHVLYTGRGQVIGEFVCDLMGLHPGTDVPSSCVPIEELKKIRKRQNACALAHFRCKNLRQAERVGKLLESWQVSVCCRKRLHIRIPLFPCRANTKMRRNAYPSAAVMVLCGCRVNITNKNNRR